MNAKKIMGAVLVALLAAALFVGAGAAAVTAADDGKTVFVGQVVPALAGSTWTNGDNKVIFNANGYITGPVVEGKYSYNDTVSMTILNPTVIISGIAGDAPGVQYDVAGSTYYLGDKLNISYKSPVTGANITNILITNPDGSKIKFTEAYLNYFEKFVKDLNETELEDWLEELQGYSNIDIPTADVEQYKTAIIITAKGKFFDTWDYTANGNITISPSVGGKQGEFDSGLIKALFPVYGTYKLQGILGDNKTGDFKFAAGVNTDNLVGQDVFTFTVGSAKDVTLTASVDSVLKGQKFTVTITGQPGVAYKLFLEEASIYSAGEYSIDNNNVFNMPNSGSITLYLIASGDEEATVGVAKAAETSADEEVTIEIQKATLTATLGAPSYFIGETIEVTLTTDGKLADSYVFNITGTNYDEVEFKDAKLKTGKDNVYELKTSTLSKKLDVGTYTIKIYDAGKLVATLPVVLKQPFISIVEAPEVVVQGKEAEFIVNAEATTEIQYYIFGTNYFLTGNTTKNVDKNTKNQFVVTLTEDNTSAKNMSTGQYFAVFQHPMYDKLFNINATNAGEVKLYSTTKANTLDFEKVLFNVSDRQTANAAQALCDALDSQNIDDMYVKASFFVVGKDESFTISEIPAEIAQGTTLTISGVSTAAAEEYVTVEMISTAFAAVPKETVGSAAFIAVTTQVAEDGTWEITLDTSDLNVDEYSLKVACGEDTWKSVNINVVEGADEPVTPPTDEPGQDEPGQDEPVAPETPGFGALAALAGLGAVAVLLLRRE